jgi:hypothetical protein
MEGYHFQYFTHARDTAAGPTIRWGNSWDFGIALVRTYRLIVQSVDYWIATHIFFPTLHPNDLCCAGISNRDTLANNSVA